MKKVLSELQSGVTEWPLESTVKEGGVSLAF